MKKHLLLLGAMALGLSLRVEAAEADFTYAQGDLFAFGKNKKEVVDIAISINDPSLIGMEITSIKAYINGTEGIDETSVWLTKELTLENKLNAPDIASYSVTPVSTNIGQYTVGLLEATLEQPYLITELPVYLGYSLTVTDNKATGADYPVILSRGNNPDGLYAHLSKSILKWMSYSETAGGVAYIVATLNGDFPEYSLGFKNYDTIFAQEDEEFEALFNVTNIGVNAVENVKYLYSVDGSEGTEEGYVELDTPLQTDLANSWPLTLKFNALEGFGPHNLSVTITEVNGQPNESVAATIEAVVNVVPFIPVKRPLIEEYTGLWCGWCTRGYFAMETIAHDYPDSQVSICYHNGDPMAVTNNYPVTIPGFPSASIDRGAAIDPYYGSYDENTQFGILLDMEQVQNEIAVAAIDVEAELDGTNVNVNSTVQFILNIDDANYQVGYVLTCNDLYNEKWLQSNYFADPREKPDYINTPLEILTTWPEEVVLHFNDVAIDVKAMSGVADSLPETIMVGEEYNGTITFNIADNELVSAPQNLVVTAFIIDKNTNKIVNANKFMFDPKSGIEKISKDGVEVIAKEYYDLTGRKVSNPAKGIYVVREKLSDGTYRTSKSLLR